MKLLALLLVMGCGTTSKPDPHELVACEGYTGGTANTECEAACAQAGSNGGVPVGSGSACMTTGSVAPCQSIDWMGDQGCCFPERNMGAGSAEFLISFFGCS